MNGYNFTERVRKVLAMAREEAGRLNHEYIVGVVAAVLVAVVLVRLLAATTIYQFERGLKFTRGRLTGELGPGMYWHLRPFGCAAQPRERRADDSA
jgi:regulator of protease activity HflC (stomatin/prohibitin superfamily)